MLFATRQLIQEVKPTKISTKDAVASLQHARQPGYQQIAVQLEAAGAR